MHHDWHMEATGSKYLPWVLVCVCNQSAVGDSELGRLEHFASILGSRAHVRETLSHARRVCESQPLPNSSDLLIFLDYLLQWKAGHTISGCYLGFRDCKWMFPQSLATLLLHFLKDYFSFYFFFFISFFLGPILQLEWIFFSHLKAACFRFQHLMESLYFE